MRLGEVLCRIAAVHPHYFNSFYRRVRVVREPPRTVPAAVTVDVTHVCSLRCPFCIAAGVLGDREMSLETFGAVAAELEGIGRLTLIGGEPFEHRDLDRLCRSARRAAAEVEVFTNGLVLGATPSAAAERVRKRIPDASSDWLTLVLSVDPDHASRLPAGRLEHAVRGLLQADAAGACRARFSVTHAALRTGSYLDTDTLVRAMESASPTLSRLFHERLMEGRIQETFYFNSVICGEGRSPLLASSRGEARGEGSGSGPEEGGGPLPFELLRLEDLVFSPEVAVSFDAAGEPVVFTSLAAMWAAAPPGDAVAGTLSEAAKRLSCRVMPGTADAPPSEEWTRAWNLAGELRDGAARDTLLRARGPLADLEAWDGGERLRQRRAESLFGLLANGVGDRPLQCGGEEGGDGLETAVLAALLSRMCGRPGWRGSLVRSLAGTVAALFHDDSGRPLRPVYAGAREILGMRVPLAPGEEHPLGQVHLPGEVGFGPRHELVVRPRLLILSDSDARLELPGIRGVPAGRPLTRRARDEALGRLLAMIAALAGPEVAVETATALPEPLRSAAADLPCACGSRLLLLPEDDPVAAFAASTFDRNRQRGDEENQALLALLLLRGRGPFSERSWPRFVSAALTWLERGPGRSPTARRLLTGVKLKGEAHRRLRRLEERWEQCGANRPPAPEGPPPERGGMS
ncbi:MAG: radical SAM protein [Deltaproteobacteria bacterium]|nr:radical SAM protein [Deltaproteobacteria bacterium]